MNTLGKTIVVNLLIMLAYVSAQFSFIVEKNPLTNVTSHPTLQWAFPTRKYHFCHRSHERKWYHYLQIHTHIIIILK